MDYRHEDQQRRQHLLAVVDRGNAEQLFTFLQPFHRRPFRNLAEVMAYEGVIDDLIDFIDCTGTKFNVTPLIIAAGKGSYEKTKVLLVHGANPNKQCSTGDTALNLAVHRQKYHIVELLLKYRANPNIYNQSGKTALHRAVVSYIDENANQIRSLLNAGADVTVEDRNQRIPLDEAVIANKPEIIGVLVSHDRTLIQRAYRAAIIAARLGHDRCLETLLDYGLDPNIMDRHRTTPLHVAVRALKLSTARLLVSRGANLNHANNRGETAIGIAEYLPIDQRQAFINVLIHTPRVAPTEFRTYTTGTAPVTTIPYVHPLLRSHANWTLDSDDFRSRTDINSSVQNLLDPLTGTYWCCTQNRDAWVIFDLKYQYNINGMRIVGCDNQSTPKSGHIDVSNASNGPWLKVKDFTCPLSQGNKTDIFFAPVKTRFSRVFITDNYGGNDIRIQGIGFYGVDMRLVNILREYGLERSLQTLLANGINDLETLDEKRDEILNSSDKYLDVNDHFQFIRLTESLRIPKLTHLEWFNEPQTHVIAGEKLHTFSAASDEGVTNRVKLEEKNDNNPQIRTVIIRDLEPIQGRSLVDFPDYVIHNPGRYKVRVVSLESPDIQTSWHDIIVDPKPPTVFTQTSDGIHGIPTTIPIRRPSSTHSTDIEKELDDRPPDFRPSRHFPRTPGPYPTSPRQDDDDEEEEEDDFHRTSTKIRPSKIDTTPQKKLIDESTQSEDKKTRNVGTMHEPVETRNFGNEVQPQSSSTQTSFLSKQKPTKTVFTYLERPEEPSTSYDDTYLDQRISPQPPQTIYYDRYEPIVPIERTKRRSPSPYEHPKRRSPSPHISDYPYDRPRSCCDTRYKDYSPHHHEHQLDLRRRYRSPSPPPPILSYRSMPKLPQDRSYTPSPVRRSRASTPHRRPHSAIPRYRPQMYSQETDTSLDAMKHQQHVGVQYEPRVTKEKGTTPSIRIKKPITSYRSVDTLLYPTPHRDYSPKTYYIQPTTIVDDYRRHEHDYEEEEEDEDEERPPSMHDQSTMAELLVNLDHYTQCDPQPYMADHYVQTTPIAYDDDDDDYYNNEQRNMYDQSEESDIRQLPLRGSISIQQPVIIQPDTLPRTRRSQYSPPRPKYDGLDYTGKNLEISLHHGQQRRTSTRNSPLLNIGTEHVMEYAPTREYTIPFETRYVYDSASSSTTRSRKTNSIRVPTINSSRTHLFTNNSVRQSRTNGNFYLSTPPPRSLNSLFRVNVTTNES